MQVRKQPDTIHYLYSKIRARNVLTDVQYKKNGRWLLKTTCTIEIEGKDKPAAIVEALAMYVVSE